MNRRGWYLAIVVLFFSYLILVAFSSTRDAGFFNHELKPVKFSLLQDHGERFNASIPKLLRQIEPIASFRSHLDGSEIWLGVELPEQVSNSSRDLLLFSHHLVGMQCWVEKDGAFTPAGGMSVGSSVLMSYQAPAWRFDSRSLANATRLVCDARFVGPVRLHLGQVNPAALQSFLSKITLEQGFLQGALVLMIALAFMASLFNRSYVFACYGFWLLGSMRLAAMSGGWDNHFFGFSIPFSDLPEVRKIAITIYFVASFALAHALFHNFRDKFWRPFVRLFQFSSLLLVSMCFWASYSWFLYVMWPVALLASIVFSCVVVQNFWLKRNATSAYYLCAMLVTSFGAMSEIVQAWFGIDFFIQYFNSSAVTVLSGIMTAVALLEYLRLTQTQREEATLEVKKAHDQLRNVFNIAPAALFVASSSGELIRCNRNFENEFLYKDGRPIFDFLRPEKLRQYWAQASEPNRLYREEFRIEHGQAPTRWYELIWAREQTDFVAVVADFSARKDRELALHFQATHDELTSALNRRGLEWAIIELLGKGAHHIRIAHIDIKRFRHVIRAYGLSFSDKLLKSFYTELYRYLSGNCEICRLHIDQFAVLFDDAAETVALADFAEFCQRLKDQPFALEGKQIILEAAICQMVFDRKAEVEDIMDAMDETAREAKILQKSKPHLDMLEFSSEETAQFLDRARAVGRLGMQELPKNLTLAWQPILSIEDPNGRLYGEALLRVRDEDGNLKSAGYLIDACVHGGQTTLLDSWVLNTTLSFLVRNAESLKLLDAISVNVSPNSLNDEFFLEDCVALIQANSSVANKLCLEITEVGAVVNLKAVQNFIHRVRALGVRIALDDFGAGYSNFRYAIDLHADVIKIDGSIIKNLAEGTESMAVARAIASLAHDLGCKCVAEWVEDDQVLQILSDLSIDYAQGFFISEAVEPELFLSKANVLEILAEQGNRAVVTAAMGLQLC